MTDNGWHGRADGGDSRRPHVCGWASEWIDPHTDSPPALLGHQRPADKPAAQRRQCCHRHLRISHSPGGTSSFASHHAGGSFAGSFNALLSISGGTILFSSSSRLVFPPSALKEVVLLPTACNLLNTLSKPLAVRVVGLGRGARATPLDPH